MAIYDPEHNPQVPETDEGRMNKVLIVAVFVLGMIALYGCNEARVQACYAAHGTQDVCVQGD